MLAILSLLFISVPLLALSAPFLAEHDAQVGLDANLDTLSSIQASLQSEDQTPPALALANNSQPQQPPTPSNSSGNLTSGTDPLVMAYYPDWASSTFPPEKINFSYFDWIDFAFALPTADYNLTWDNPNTAPDLLHRLVEVAHKNGKKAKLSVGGWTGSKFFSGAVATDVSRRLFASNIRSLYDQFGLDGIDIDWEYPGRSGQLGNEQSSQDSLNYLAFLQILRATLPPEAKISAATQSFPFSDPQGESMRDVHEFAKVLDWILLMNYDVWGASSAPGPNAPFYDTCHNSTQPEANAVAAFNAWTNAGFPASQLVLGLPFYGYINPSTATSLRTRSSPPQARQNGPFRVTDEDGGYEGQIQFKDLVSQGALVSSPSNPDGALQFVGGNGFTRYWDQCSSTPFLRSPDAAQVVTYDDPESLGLKARFAKGSGMLGVNVFDVHGDTESWDLIHATREGLELIVP